VIQRRIVSWKAFLADRNVFRVFADEEQRPEETRRNCQDLISMEIGACQPSAVPLKIPLLGDVEDL
jgi:hypothetical protein